MAEVKQGTASNSLAYQTGFGGFDPHPFLRGLTDMQDRCLAILREWERRAYERGRLSALSDQMVADIGLTREEADCLGRKPFWKE